ncbi:MAG: hypothetical protein EAZ97_06270 [Bacteroidetes bacterium]|nr:MAG: hypothetical protein EAZ97_06270 [Bacteroidota bacterium]
MTAFMFSGCSSSSTSSDPVVVAIPTNSVKFTITVPATTPAADKIYIAGAFKNTAEQWKPDQAKYALTKAADGTHSITIALADLPASFDFKFARGNWDKVEKAAATATDKCPELDNRNIPSTTAGGKEFKYTITQWADFCAK